MEGSGLSAKQRRAIELLAQGATRREAAKSSGISERTLFRYLHDPIFAQELERVERELWRATLSGLKSGIRRSLDYLISVLNDEKADKRDRLQAARTLMQTALRVIEAVELGELRARVEALEKLLEGNDETRLALNGKEA